MIKKMAEKNIEVLKLHSSIQCNLCDNTISVSKTLFKIRFKEGTDQILCTYCLTEIIADQPENVKSIKNIGEAV